MNRRLMHQTNLHWNYRSSCILDAQGIIFFQTQVAPIIQAGHEGIVHHMLVYECSDNFPKHHLNYTGHCYSSNMPPEVEECTGTTAIAAWAIGGKVSTVAIGLVTRVYASPGVPGVIHGGIAPNTNIISRIYLKRSVWRNSRAMAVPLYDRISIR